MKRETKTDVTEQLYDLLGSVILILKFRTFNKFQFVFSVTQLNSETWPVQNENNSIQYPVWFSNTEVSVFILKNTE